MNPHLVFGVAYLFIFIHLLFSSTLYGSHADYIFFVPHLISNKIYFLKNGLFSLPYYTPAFQGGSAQFADIQDVTFSLVQWLVNILPNVYIALDAAFVLHLILSYAGMVRLLKKFGNGPWVSAWGGFIFSLNGYIVCRWLIGHLVFQTLWTIPWMLAFLQDAIERNSFKKILGPLIGLAVLTSVNLYSSGIYPLAIFGLLALTLLLTHVSLHRKAPLPALGTLSAGLILGALLTLGKITAIASYLRQFPRLMENDRFSLAQLAQLIPRALFDPSLKIQDTAPAHIGGWHEYSAYIGGTLVLILIVGYTKAKRDSGLLPLEIWTALTCLIGCYLMLGSNLFWTIVKDWPFLRSNHGVGRLMGAYPVVFIVLACGLLSRLKGGRKSAGVALILGLVAIVDIGFYNAGHAIDKIYSVPLDYPADLSNVSIDRWQNHNIYGGVRAPNPLFGWDGKFLNPAISLDKSPLDRHEDGSYNVNDPTAMVYAPEVGRPPWSRIPGSVPEKEVRKFLEFKKTSFFVSEAQKTANAISLALWMAVAAGFIFITIKRRKTS